MSRTRPEGGIIRRYEAQTEFREIMIHGHWAFDRTAARRKFGYKKNSFTRS